MKEDVYVILNEQHSLFKEQEEILDNDFDNWDIVPIPKEGLTLDQIENYVSTLHKDDIIVIASPIPAIFKYLDDEGIYFYVFHNDNRNKKQLSNGKIIQIVAETGWVLV